MITILGGGLSGVSASYYLGHNNCKVYEKNNYLGGHIYSQNIDGFVWDEGPHVSFTNNVNVQNLLADSVDFAFSEFPVKIANYYRGTWIPHPAQSNLFAVPQELRDKCLNEIIALHKEVERNLNFTNNYEEWLKKAFGETFYEHFSKPYTLKYWSVDPKDLTTDWVGQRVALPDLESVKTGYFSESASQDHYIKKIRYPNKGGFYSYLNKIKKGLNYDLNKNLESINFDYKKIRFEDGSEVNYSKLISTIPLPVLIKKSNAPKIIKEEAEKLSCTSVLIINISADHITSFEYNWMYVYDENMLSTRINFTELLSPNNAPLGKTGIQVEVYFSRFNQLRLSIEEVVSKVKSELIEMKIIRNSSHIIGCNYKIVKWANVLFDHQREESLDKILNFLSTKGLSRNTQDLLPMTNWDDFREQAGSSIFLAGRYSEWKYYWTDDCILRGASLKNSISQ